MSLPADARLERLIERGKFSGAFFFHGDAFRLRDDAARHLVDSALEPATRDFNLTNFRGGDLQPEALAAALATPPMMGPRRAVVLWEAERLAPAARKAVLAALSRLPADVLFVVCATVPRGSTAAFYRTLRERCTSLEWKALREEEVPGWAMERARSRHGFGLPSTAAQALASAVGADLSMLDAELAKLAGAAEGGTISVARARELLPDVRRADRWQWLDLVAARRYEEALRLLEGALAGDSAVSLLASMVDQHLYVGLALEGGTSLVREALAEAGKPYLRWKAPAYGRQARAWTTGELERALRLMRRADRQLKSGGGDRAVLQDVLLALRLLARKAA